MTTKKLELGHTVMTAGIAALTETNHTFARQILACLDRHAHGDWGVVDAQDKELNDEALALGNRVLSAYIIEGTKIWIITEWDRSVTTILLPMEY